MGAMSIRRLRWKIEPLFTFGFLIVPPVGMIWLVETAFPELLLVWQVVIGVVGASIVSRMVSTIDGLGRFPQRVAHNEAKLEQSDRDDIGTEHHSIFDLLAVYAIVGVLVGVMLAL